MLLHSRSYQVIARKDIDRLPQLQGLPQQERDAMRAVAAVMPFRVNNYVVEELIDWNDIPDDPIFRLTFPHPEMLSREQFTRMLDLVQRDAPAPEITAAAREIQLGMNPHPAGQQQLNIPRVNGQSVDGMQHKYRETVLLFPAAGQTCHAYCTYCFRWAQFVGIEELKIAGTEAHTWADYLREHDEVRSVLFTGGDPMLMNTNRLRRYIDPLLGEGLDHIESIRIGSKAISYWPHRFVTDPDAGELLELFERVRASGRHLAFMAHFSHPRQLETPIAQEAIRRIQETGAIIRCQAPLIRHVNDSTETWSTMWQQQTRQNTIPYYMFVERDTGPRGYFEVPLARAHELFVEAYRKQSGLGRTVRGPVMSATPGKVLIDGIADVGGERVFVLKFLQARNPDWVGRPFFARFDPEATWLDDLKPAFGERRFFFEEHSGRTRPRALRFEQAVESN